MSQPASRDGGPASAQRWTSVFDAGPHLSRRWVRVQSVPAPRTVVDWLMVSVTKISTTRHRCITNRYWQAGSWLVGGGPRVVVSTAAFHARVRGSVPGFGGLKKTKMFLPHPRVKVSIVGSLRDRDVACSASDRQGPNFESCVWRTVSSQSSHHPQEVLLAQFSLYVHKGDLKPDSFHFIFVARKHTLRSAGRPLRIN